MNSKKDPNYDPSRGPSKEPIKEDQEEEHPSEPLKTYSNRSHEPPLFIQTKSNPFKLRFHIKSIKKNILSHRPAMKMKESEALDHKKKLLSYTR